MKQFLEHEQVIMAFYVSVLKGKDKVIPVASEKAGQALRARCYALTKAVKRAFESGGEYEEAWRAVSTVGVRILPRVSGGWVVEFFNKTKSEELQTMVELMEREGARTAIDPEEQDAAASAERMMARVEELKKAKKYEIQPKSIHNPYESKRQT